MEAQNAAEPASTKPSASPKRPAAPTEPDPSRSSVSTSPGAVRSSAPPVEDEASRPRNDASSGAQDDDDGGDGNSDAETIVLPGKDGQPSPSKTRKLIKHEARSDGEESVEAPTSRSKHPGSAGQGKDGGERSEQRSGGAASSEGATSLSEQGQKRRLHEKQQRGKDTSSGLSSVPASPPRHRRRRLSNARSDSDSDSAAPTSPRSRDEAGSVDRLVSHKRKAPKHESDDEGESRKVRRQRTASGTGIDVPNLSRVQRDAKPSSKSHHDAHPSSRSARSISPHPRTHRRSLSTQLTSQPSNGLGHKKKRVPAPLQSTEYHSDESSAGGSPRIRNAKLRSLTTPAAAESTISPAKMLAPHKKHLDAHGQTLLARACARGEYDGVKQRLQERPEDMDVADYAGNTPLQIASLNGYEEIVKLLIEAGCNVECMNNDKDTPLLDAVDNGHLGVVRLLLDAGVNPRKANVNGEEPVDRLTDDLDNVDEIRKALVAARQKMGDRRRTSEEHHHDQDARSSHGPDSPRQSPAAASSSALASSSRRGGTVRSTKTSNHLLYMPMDDKTLRLAAGKGDEETVTRILQVRDTFDDPESMVAAARGGHDIVMQLLLALGNANPDPAPVSSMAPELATPMLAAIGQENIKVVRLLLDQASFDPTRRFKGETYYDIATRRQGTNWKEEEHMLKAAYDAYKKSHGAKTKSPNRREQDREARRAGRTERDDGARSQKRRLSSPTREGKKTGSSKVPSSPRQKRRSDSFSATQDDQTSPRRGAAAAAAAAAARTKRDERVPSAAATDRDRSPSASKLPGRPRRADPDMAAVSSEGETIKPRRKLISGKDLKGEREKQRRASMASNASSMREPSSPRDARHEDFADRPKTEKYHDRAKALKRDESRDRISFAGEGSSKRHRSSETPPHHGSSEKEGGEAPVKRRRLDADGKEKRPKPGSSTDERPRKASPSRETSKASAKDQDDADRKERPKAKKTDADLNRRESGKSYTSERSIHVKSEDADVEMRDADQPAEDAAAEAQAQRQREEEQKRQAEAEALALDLAKKKKKEEEEEQKRREQEERRQREEAEAKKKAEEEKTRLEEEERKRKEEEEEKEKKRKEEEERKKREEEEKKRREEEKRKEEERRREEERRKEEKRKEQKRKEEEERKKREEEERKRKEEEERRKREEEARLRREEEERLKREAEEKRRAEEEEQRRKREEEERLRREQLEREAAEEARRKREEEERKEKERRRAAKEADQRRIFLEQERIRLDKLPPLLRWFDGCANPRSPAVAEKFAMMQGVRYDCIRQEANGTADGREQWLLNTQVALLLGEKDLALSRYTAWERVPVSSIAKRVLWRLESDRYALTTPGLYDVGRQLPGYYCGEDPDTMSYRVVEKLRGEAWKRFAAVDMFFVRASELMYIIATIPHLRNLKLTVAYRELPEHESQLLKWTPLQKWKGDPDADRFHGFAPGNKYYVNGELVHEAMPGVSAISKTPFPERPVPRRGFMEVSPDDPDYAAICREQGLGHLVHGSPGLPPDRSRHSSSSPAPGAGLKVDVGSAQEDGAGEPGGQGDVNGNGGHPTPISTTSPAQSNGSLPNGVDGS